MKLGKSAKKEPKTVSLRKRNVNSPMYIGARVVMLICGVFMVVFMLRFLHKNLLIDKFNIRLTFMDELLKNDNPGAEVLTKLEFAEVNWTKKYPFKESATKETAGRNQNGQEQKRNSLQNNVWIKRAENFESKIFNLESKIEYYYDKELLWKNALLNGGTFFADVTGWDMPATAKDSKYIFWDGKVGHISICLKQMDVTESAQNVVDFAERMKEQEIPFLYVQFPCKMSNMEQEKLPDGYESFADANTDAFLNILSDNGVNCVDLRKKIAQSEQKMFSLFFRTDHHWKPSTGLWATGEVAKYLSDQGIDVDTSLYQTDKYSTTIYEKNFLGSYGRAVTMSLTTPDDFEVILPDFETELQVWVPERNVDVTGDFEETLMDWQMLYPEPSYEVVQYSTYAWGDVGLMQIENLKADNTTKLLVVKDSFANVVTPYLALGVKELSVIDLRHFNGSLQSFVGEYKPDMVLVCYNPGSFAETGSINYKGHESTMDFR